jgi:ketosteroid isomerase-like protein
MTPKELYLEAMRRSDAGDHEGFLALQAPDAHWVVPGAEIHGHEELRGWLQPFWQGFSSYRHDLSRVIESGDTVWAEGVWSGMNDGPLVTPGGEAPATGRQVTFRFGMSVVIDAEAGHATAVSLYFDQLDFLGQLGMIPEGAAG